MRFRFDSSGFSFVSNLLKRSAMILAVITYVFATLLLNSSAQAQDVAATITNVQRFASGSQPTQLLATVTLEDVLIDGRGLERQRVTFSLTGTQRDVQLAIGIHEGDTIERIDARVTPVSLSTSGLKTFYISHQNQAYIGSFVDSLSDDDRLIVHSICGFLTYRRNINTIIQRLIQSTDHQAPSNYIPTRAFFEASSLNVMISELVFISNRCVDAVTAPIRTMTAAASPQNDTPSQSPATQNALGNEVLSAVPALSDALRDIQSLIDNSVPLETYTALNNELQSVQQELAALRRSTVPRSQYEQLQASTVSRQVHDRLSQQLRNVQNEIAALRGSTVSTAEHTRVEQQLAEAEAEIARLTVETVPKIQHEALEARLATLEEQLYRNDTSDAPTSADQEPVPQLQEQVNLVDQEIENSNKEASTGFHFSIEECQGDNRLVKFSNLTNNITITRLSGELFSLNQNGHEFYSRQIWETHILPGSSRTLVQNIPCNYANFSFGITLNSLSEAQRTRNDKLSLEEIHSLVSFSSESSSIRWITDGYGEPVQEVARPNYSRRCEPNNTSEFYVLELLDIILGRISPTEVDIMAKGKLLCFTGVAESRDDIGGQTWVGFETNRVRCIQSEQETRLAAARVQQAGYHVVGEFSHVLSDTIVLRNCNFVRM